MPDRLLHRVVISSRATLLAFLASGAIWIATFVLATRDLWLPLILAAVMYVTLSSLLLASKRLRTGPAVLTLWVTAIVLLTAVGYLADGGFWMSLSYGALIGSLVFAPWCLTGFFLLHVFTGGASGGPSPDDGR